MKKIFIIYIILFLILTGCLPSSSLLEEQQPVGTPTPNQSVTEVRPFSFKIAASSDDGLWYPLGKAISTQVTGNISNVEAVTQSTTSLMESMKLLTSGKVGMAFGYDYHVILANQGKLARIFPDAPVEKLSIKCGVEITRVAFPDYSQPARIVIPLYEQFLHVITTNSTGITSLNDLKGKRVSTGAPGSSTEEQAGYILKSLGMDWDKDIVRMQWNAPEAVAALKDGKIDALFWSGEIPTFSIAELASNSNLKMVMLPIQGEEAETIIQTNPAVFHMSKISADSYSGMESDVETLAVTTVLITMEDFPSDYARQAVATIFEKKGELALVWAGAQKLTPEIFTTQLTPEVSTYLHEGSKTYIEEQGIQE